MISISSDFLSENINSKVPAVVQMYSSCVPGFTVPHKADVLSACKSSLETNDRNSLCSLYLSIRSMPACLLLMNRKKYITMSATHPYIQGEKRSCFHLLIWDQKTEKGFPLMEVKRTGRERKNFINLMLWAGHVAKWFVIAHCSKKSRLTLIYLFFISIFFK